MEIDFFVVVLVVFNELVWGGGGWFVGEFTDVNFDDFELESGRVVSFGFNLIVVTNVKIFFDEFLNVIWNTNDTEIVLAVVLGE